MHAWPCTPYSQHEYAVVAEIPWSTLSRCAGCGALWQSLDRGAKRLTVAEARAEFGVDVPAFARPPLGGGAPVTRVHAWLNGETLFRILVDTGLGRWQVGERGALLWQEWRDDMAGPAVTGDRAVELAREAWGSAAGSALELAPDSGFDPRQLGALDLAQSLPRETWSAPWQPRTVDFVATMLAEGADVEARVAVVLAAPLRGGALTEADIVAAGFPIPRGGA